MILIRNKEGQILYAQLNALADGTPITSGTTEVRVIKDGVSTTGLGVVYHIDSGSWAYEPTAAETDATNLAFVFDNDLAGNQTVPATTKSVFTIPGCNGELVDISNIMDDFKARFPQFDEPTIDAILPSLIAEYKSYYCREYTCETQAAILQLLAHMYKLEIDDSDEAMRNVSSTSVDGVSESYEARNADTNLDIMFSTTKYGEKFLYLIQSDQGTYFV
jgi:hypothetical protein